MPALLGVACIDMNLVVALDTIRARDDWSALTLTPPLLGYPYPNHPYPTPSPSPSPSPTSSPNPNPNPNQACLQRACRARAQGLPAGDHHRTAGSYRHP